MLLILSIFARAAAQDDDVLPDSFPVPPGWFDTYGDTCFNPSMDNFAVIHYQNYSKAYMEIHSITGTPISTIGFKELGSANLDFQPRTIQPDGGILLNNLLPGRLYAVQTYNTCGQPVVFAFEVNRDDDDPEMIEVPEVLFEAISEYTRMDVPQKFPDYLASRTDINPYVKTAFIQQYFFRGRPFDSDFGDLVPTVPPIDSPDSCYCTALKTALVVQPANINFAAGTMTDEEQEGGGYDKRKRIAGYDNTNYWYWLNNRGAAKWHQLNTEGKKAAKSKDLAHNMSWIRQDSASYIASYQQAKIKTNLFCMDGDMVPKECECRKKIIYWYRYDTRVHTEAHLRNGGSSSVNAVAQAEDMAIISSFEESNVEQSYRMLKFLMARKASACDRAAVPSFWTKMIDLYSAHLDIGLSILGFKKDKIDTVQVRKLANSVIKYLNKVKDVVDPPEPPASSCTLDADVFSDVEGSDTTYIRPNVVQVLAINSFDKLYSGGRRSWYSNARINSNFFIAAEVLPSHEGPRHCCTRGMATWVVGSCAGPLSTEALKREVTTFFYLKDFSGFVPDNGSPNGITMPAEFGVLTRKVANEYCNRFDSGLGSGLNGDVITDRSINYSGYSNLSIWDVSGRLIANFNESVPFNEMDALIRAKLTDLVPGVYFVRTEANGIATTRKIFVR